MIGKFYTSMKEASADMQLPLQIIKSAKINPNCKAFHPNGRIDIQVLQTFVRENMEELQHDAEDNLQKWKTMLTKFNAQIAEKELEELEGKYILRTEAEDQIRAIALSQKAMLRSRLVQELPQKLVGMTVPQMTVVMEDTLTEICELMNSLKVDE